MAETVAGGAAELALHPFLLAYLEPSSPLQHSEVVLRKLLMMADKRLPIVYAPGGVDGATGPVTPAGSLAQANAEVLSGLTIAQLRQPGTPVVYGSGNGPLDMRTTVAVYGSPEFMLHCKAMAELGQRFYHLPTWGFSGCSDSKAPDVQAGIESSLWILWTALSGANLVHDIGFLDCADIGSLEMLVMSDEIIAMTKRIMRGIEITDETLMLDLIDDVGPSGEYISSDETARRCRQEITQLHLMDRDPWDVWQENDSMTLYNRIKLRLHHILDNHKPLPVPEGLDAKIEAILNAAEEQEAEDVDQI
jgi:trimethylamine--corrinoid protein Co-methyltransferase